MDTWIRVPGYVVTGLMVLAHLAGLVVAIILLVRKKGVAATLATIAFVLLLLLDVGWILRTASLDDRIWQALTFRTIPWAIGGLNCCCGLFDLGAIVCLIIALWRGISGPAAGEAEEEIAV